MEIQLLNKFKHKFLDILSIVGSLFNNKKHGLSFILFIKIVNVHKNQKNSNLFKASTIVSKSGLLFGYLSQH